MMNSAKLLRVFWPADALRSTVSGVIVGWKNGQFDFFVISVIADADVRNIENALQAGTLFMGSAHPVSRLLERCGGRKIEVIGTLNRLNQKDAALQPHLLVFSDAESPLPAIYCPVEAGLSPQIVIYEKPQPKNMQYVSLTPISLAIENLKSVEKHQNSEAALAKERLVKKLQFHSIRKRELTEQDLMLPTIIGQINCSWELEHLMAKNAHLIGLRHRKRLSVSERVVEQAQTVWWWVLTLLWQIWTTWLYPIILDAFTFGLLCHRCAGEGILRALEWRYRPDSAALKDISATIQQVEIRLQQFCYWPIQYSTMKHRNTDWVSNTDNHPEYIRFYNSLWLVANDIIMGVALGSFIIENAEPLSNYMNNALSEWTIVGLKSIIVWLTDWPAGLKLNNELASFLADLVLWVLEYWSFLIRDIQPTLQQLVMFIGFSSFAGASMPIALCSDLLSLLTVHIYAFYIASARIYHWQLTIIVSLFHLFRGRKQNVLRNRIDSCDYDLDQLLLGTILFTLLVFLLPTVAVFYITFAAARMVIIFLKAAMDTVLAFLNHFPLFALMLRIKDSRRLPGGISFELRSSPSVLPKPLTSEDVSTTAYLVLKPVPLSLAEMFTQYFVLGSKIRGHYLSAKVAFYLLTGQFVPPMDRRNLYSLQYSMLPSKRPSVGEMWRIVVWRKGTKRNSLRGIVDNIVLNNGQANGTAGK